ncbi:replication protein RepC [Escherichia coli]|nr:replication protein RepC [Escherichia coli]
MLSQLNLRFHKKLIEALKTRAGRENTSVNALAERFLDDGLKTVAPGDGYFSAHCRSGGHGPAAVPAYHSGPDLRHVSALPRRTALCPGSRQGGLPARA